MVLADNTTVLTAIAEPVKEGTSENVDSIELTPMQHETASEDMNVTIGAHGGQNPPKSQRRRSSVDEIGLVHVREGELKQARDVRLREEAATSGQRARRPAKTVMQPPLLGACAAGTAEALVFFTSDSFRPDSMVNPYDDAVKLQKAAKEDSNSKTHHVHSPNDCGCISDYSCCRVNCGDCLGGCTDCLVYDTCMIDLPCCATGVDICNGIFSSCGFIFSDIFDNCAECGNGLTEQACGCPIADACDIGNAVEQCGVRCCDGVPVLGDLLQSLGQCCNTCADTGQDLFDAIPFSAAGEALGGAGEAVLGSAGDVLGSLGTGEVLGSAGDVLGSAGDVLGSAGDVLGGVVPVVIEGAGAVLNGAGAVLGAVGDIAGALG
jgi:hypothetical protein